jgi:hypothetical protein
VYVSSSETSPVSEGLSFTQANSPTVSGSPWIGNRLFANASGWVPSPASLTWQWLRNGMPIRGATSNYYDIGVADEGETLTVRMTASLSGYATTSLISSSTGQVTTWPVTTKTFRGTESVSCPSTSGPGGLTVKDYGLSWNTSSGTLPLASYATGTTLRVFNAGPLYYSAQYDTSGWTYFYEASPKLSGRTFKAYGKKTYYLQQSGQLYYQFGGYETFAKVWITCEGEFY